MLQTLNPDCCHVASQGLMHFTVLQKHNCIASPMCYSLVTLPGPVGTMRESRECRRATGIPFPLVLTKQKGRLHSSKQIKETVAEFFTLFSHSTRSTSGKCTYNREKRAGHLYVPVAVLDPFRGAQAHLQHI